MRCLIIDDDPRDADLVERMVARAGHESRTAVGCDAALEYLRGGTFDVALVDLGMPEVDGVTTLRKLHDAAPDLRLLVITGFDDRQHVLDAVAAGADGYLLKSELGERLAPALNEVTGGGGPMSSRIAHFVLEELRRSPEGTQPGDGGPGRSLSQREYEVLQGLSNGWTYAEIATNLHISVNTVRHHIRNLYGKLEVTGKAAAVTRGLHRDHPRLGPRTH